MVTHIQIGNKDTEGAGMAFTGLVRAFMDNVRMRCACERAAIGGMTCPSGDGDGWPGRRWERPQGGGGIDHPRKVQQKKAQTDIFSDPRGISYPSNVSVGTVFQFSSVLYSVFLVLLCLDSFVI